MSSSSCVPFGGVHSDDAKRNSSKTYILFSQALVSHEQYGGEPILLTPSERGLKIWEWDTEECLPFELWDRMRNQAPRPQKVKHISHRYPFFTVASVLELTVQNFMMNPFCLSNSVHKWRFCNEITMNYNHSPEVVNKENSKSTQHKETDLNQNANAVIL